MKSRYRKLKQILLLRAFLTSVLLVAVGYGILAFLADGIPQDSFQRFMTGIFTKTGMSTDGAAALYTRLFINGRALFVLGGFFLLFLIFLSGRS